VLPVAVVRVRFLSVSIYARTSVLWMERDGEVGLATFVLFQQLNLYDRGGTLTELLNRYYGQ
jgi:hypothetical protein